VSYVLGLLGSEHNEMAAFLMHGTRRGIFWMFLDCHFLCFVERIT